MDTGSVCGHGVCVCADTLCVQHLYERRPSDVRLRFLCVWRAHEALGPCLLADWGFKLDPSDFKLPSSSISSLEARLDSSIKLDPANSSLAMHSWHAHRLQSFQLTVIAGPWRDGMALDVSV